MKKMYVAFGLLTALAATLTASSASAGCLERIYPNEIQGRNAWAAMWGYITPDEEMQLNTSGRYIEFSNGCFRTISGAPCSTVVPITAGGAYVPGLMLSSYCNQYDCYTPSQRILVDGAYMGIEDAATAQSKTITTLTPGSTLEEPILGEQSVSAFSWAPVSEDIYVLEGDGGERLEVTGGHPMVLSDGTLSPANELREGDTLAAPDGGMIRLVRVNTYAYEGKVWNVSPRSEEKTANVVVAEGYLAGSLKLQNQAAYESFRLSVRDHVDTKKLSDAR